MTQRYEMLTPDDIISMVYQDDWSYDPPYCKVTTLNNGKDYAYICPEGATCRNCLKAWLEEEVKQDPVWYSKEFIMEQVAALIEHDESGLSLFHILDEVLADTPEQIRYGSVDAYFEAILEAMEEKA